MKTYPVTSLLTPERGSPSAKTYEKAVRFFDAALERRRIHAVTGPLRAAILERLGDESQVYVTGRGTVATVKVVHPRPVPRIDPVKVAQAEAEGVPIPYTLSTTLTPATVDGTVRRLHLEVIPPDESLDAMVDRYARIKTMGKPMEAEYTSARNRLIAAMDTDAEMSSVFVFPVDGRTGDDAVALHVEIRREVDKAAVKSSLPLHRRVTFIPDPVRRVHLEVGEPRTLSGLTAVTPVRTLQGRGRRL